jgi:hypothetical protein
MQIDMSIQSGTFCHLGLRSRLARRSSRVPAGTGGRLLAALLDQPVK